MFFEFLNVRFGDYYYATILIKNTFCLTRDCRKYFFQGKLHNPNTLPYPNTNSQRLFFEVYKKWTMTVKKINFSHISYFYEILLKNKQWIRIT